MLWAGRRAPRRFRERQNGRASEKRAHVAEENPFLDPWQGGGERVSQ